jgi:hypothetical protein
MYLLDANVLITANHTYYPIDKVPEFWDWLLFKADNGELKIPLEIIEELKGGRKENDLLSEWIRDKENEQLLLLDTEVQTENVQLVVERGYAPDLTDNEYEKIGRDAFLIAHAISLPNSIVVTAEQSKPRRIRANRHVPDVCKDVGVECCDQFTMQRDLDFKTGWRKS